MLNLKKFIGIIAMVAIIGFVFLGCEEEKPNLVPGLKGAAKVDSLPNFEKDFVEDEAAALTLFSEAISALTTGGMSSAILAAQQDALVEQGGSSTADPTASSASFSVSVPSSSTALAVKIKSSDATMKDKAKASISANRPLADFYEIMFSDTKVFAKGDNMKESSSLERTVTIPTLWTIKQIYGDTVVGKFAGTIYVNSKSSSSMKVAEVDTAKDYPYTFTGNESSSGKAAAAFVYDNGTNGAKFRISASSGEKSYSRVTGEESGSVASAIEVYNNANELKYEIEVNNEGGGYTTEALVKSLFSKFSGNYVANIYSFGGLDD